MLLAVAPLLGVAVRYYPVLVDVTVCNQAGDLLVKDVGVAVGSRQSELPLHGLGSLGPGECLTTELEQPYNEGSVRLAYSAAGTRHDQTEGYVMGGDHAWFMVRGPDEVRMDIDPPGMLHPRFILGVLAMLCFFAGGLYLFLGCIRFLEDRLKRELSD